MRHGLIWTCITLICSCAFVKRSKFEEAFVARGYYFVIQLQSAKSDTIFFEAIEIYSPSPVLDVTEDSTSIVHIVKMPLKKFNIGYLKGVKKKDFGKVLLLYTNPSWITNEGFVKFDYVDYPGWTDLSKMYRLGEIK